MAKGGTQCTTMSSQCAFDSTINRSGARARNLSPIARIAPFTRPTWALSSVSGRVRNCGACGTIAAPTMPGRLSDLLLIFASLLQAPPAGELAYAGFVAVQGPTLGCIDIQRPSTRGAASPCRCLG